MSQMPINKKEQLIYTVLMVFVMASVLTTYNIVIHQGFSLESIKQAWLIFPITASIAFFIEVTFVGKIAFKLISKFVKESDPLPKKILISALCFVTQMVLLMSTICALLFNPFNENWLSGWLISIPRNFIMAYPLQVLIAGPLVGFVFRKLFPIGTIIDPVKK